MTEWNLVKTYWEDNIAKYLSPTFLLHQKHHKRTKHLVVKAEQQDLIRQEKQTTIPYQLHIKLLIEDLDDYYHEEWRQQRIARFEEGWLLDDHPVARTISDNLPRVQANPLETRFVYDRRAAVRYAERWWNSANPAYHYFEENDCTNYVSQCLKAGGIPMHGMPNRSEGWWYGQGSWSYSWAVAHSFRWYLAGAVSKWQGREVNQASELSPGDVICYDFEGNGRWDHNTIVVAKDSQNQPLVNAHTNNSRNRFWTYEDSAAWTPACEYLFFRISD
ncbi:amidase domain-containing protein [Gracilibacillus alcaliphilus]|uniref:amidase domain-containing protein n=1 Tax=Gracilibacillus alcaliphilus TaxID=1401441 RepID=UPI00195C0FAF|nr:amidase domain-containing protein [Gracilibacillus alcaliphilus]MBM7676368.1 hypothetical protein [Gracilibacillus alcaliphilus]